MTAFALPGRPVPLADRMARHRNSRRQDVSWERATFDVLARRRETAEDPPDFLESVARVTRLRDTKDTDALRGAAINAAVAALAIVTRLSPRDTTEDPDEK